MPVSSHSIQAVVFDFDGTLVETSDIKTNAFGKLYEPFGEEIAEKVIDYHKKHMGVSRYTKFKVWHEEFLGQQYSDDIGARLSEQFSDIVKSEVVKASYVPGALALLDNLHNKIPLYIASATPNDELNEIVSLRGMKHYFYQVVGTPTTKREVLEEVIGELNVDPKKVLMVGDAISDWEAHNATGSMFVGRVAKGQTSPFPDDVIIVEDLVGLARIIL